MYYVRKLKPNDRFWGLLIPFTFLLITAIIWVLYGIELAAYTLSGLTGLLVLFNLVVFFRTKNPGILVVVLFNISEMVMFANFPGLAEGSQLARLSLVVTVFLLLVVQFLTATRRIKWRGTELFELAGMAVGDTGNGYTPRPRPAGMTDVSREELLRFAKFFTRHQIGVAFVEPKRVVFVPVVAGTEYGYILGIKNRYQSETYVSIEDDGHVTVQITQRDYLYFQQDLAFDQLCQALGDTLIEFVDLFSTGQGVRIIDRMNTLKIDFFS